MVSPSQVVNSLYNGVQLTMGLFGDSAAANAKRQYNYQRALNQQAYDLTMQGYREGPLNQRKGLETAGYNPILAVQNGVSNATFSGGSAGMGTNDTGSQKGAMLANAFKIMQLERQKTGAEIANLSASTSSTNAGISLIKEQAKTEQYRQKEMESQTALNNINKMLGDKSLSWYDKRQLMEIKTGYINAQANHLSSEAAQLNAHTAQADYRMRKGITDYENVNRAALADFISRHPGIKATGNFLDTLGLKLNSFVKR